MQQATITTKPASGAIAAAAPTAAAAAAAAAASAADAQRKPSYDINDIKPTPKRYLILLLFCMHSMINAAQWIYLSSITNMVSKFYHVDNMAVNWSSMVYMLVYIPLVVPASWLFERLGMRNSILLGSLGTSLGALIKLFACAPNRFGLLMLGQTLVAVCQLFVLSVPPRLASVWFPDEQVSLATACGVFGNQLGIALGFVVPPLVVHSITASSDASSSFETLVGNDLYSLHLAICVLSTLTSLLILVAFDHTPRKPPGVARLQQILQEQAEAGGIAPLVSDDASGSGARPSGRFTALLVHLLTDKNFVLLVVSYGLNVGVFYAISTVLNQMIAPNWPPQEANALVGRLGLVMVVSGMCGSIISGYMLDRTHKYRLVNASLYAMTLVSMLFFALIITFKHTALLYVSVVLLGYSMTGYLFIGYEMSNEITWPLPESVSAGLLNLSAQVFGVALTYAGSCVVDAYGNLPANCFFATAIFAGLLVTLAIKTQLKRQNAIDTRSCDV